VLDLHGVFGDVLAGSAACEFVFDAAADGDGGAVVGDEGCAVCEREVLAVSGRKGGSGSGFPPGFLSVEGERGREGTYRSCRG